MALVVLQIHGRQGHRRQPAHRARSPRDPQAGLRRGDERPHPVAGSRGPRGDEDTHVHVGVRAREGECVLQDGGTERAARIHQDGQRERRLTVTVASPGVGGWRSLGRRRRGLLLHPRRRSRRRRRPQVRRRRHGEHEHDDQSCTQHVRFTQYTHAYCPVGESRPDSHPSGYVPGRMQPISVGATMFILSLVVAEVECRHGDASPHELRPRDDVRRPIGHRRPTGWLPWMSQPARAKSGPAPHAEPAEVRHRHQLSSAQPTERAVAPGRGLGQDRLEPAGPPGDLVEPRRIEAAADSVVWLRRSSGVQEVEAQQLHDGADGERIRRDSPNCWPS